MRAARQIFLALTIFSILFTISNGSFAAERVYRTIEDYDMAISLEPNNAKTYYNRGNAYYGKGQYDRAIVDFNKAISLDSNNAFAYYNNRGYAYYGKGQYDRAIADYNMAISLYPNYATTAGVLITIKANLTWLLPISKEAASLALMTDVKR